MLNHTRVARIQSRFQAAYDPPRRLFNNVWFLSLSGLTLIAIIIVTPLLYASTTWLVIALGIVFLTSALLALTGWLIHRHFHPWKATLLALQADVVALLAEEGMNVYAYEAMRKPDKAVYRESGLFTRHAMVSERYRFKGTTASDIPYTFHECVLSVNQGQYGTRTVFSGAFIVMPSRGGTYQIRSQGKPRHKGVSYQKTHTEGRLSLYTATQPTSIPRHQQKALEAMMDAGVKHVYFASNESHTILAIARPFTRARAPLTREMIGTRMQALKDDLAHLERLIDDRWDW